MSNWDAPLTGLRQLAQSLIGFEVKIRGIGDRSMRLIDTTTLELREFSIGDIPAYGILSHLWSRDEMTFQDMLQGTRHSSTGFAKIKRLARIAESDGLRYVWADSVCIDKSSSSELSEAINSMYRWFENSEKCYVYLDDVLMSRDGEMSSDSLERDFRRSIWFKRGWTLQELIAPWHVVFYSKEWSVIGTKMGLSLVIQDITRIPAEVLNRSKRPDEYSVSQRLAWAAHRVTTRPEDRAYCLLGLFGVNMPLLYGEGDIAFQRLLKEIMSLTTASSGLRLLVVDSLPLMIDTFSEQDAPPYAILSHTWGNNEVSFQDVITGKAPERKAYSKIAAACAKAKEHGFSFLWVDSACIDKSSSSELQEAICSMYKWYKNAGMCFAYLEDYPEKPLDQCRWFGRGWTLQELIAPRYVTFYNSKWQPLGTKSSLCDQIASITKIDERILRGADPTERTVAERMSWASTRKTTRVEDEAYSLMGLFNVFMPMLYGEGRRAFFRLQEEIMKQTEDNTILAWHLDSSGERRRGLFATSPADFQTLKHHDKTIAMSHFATEDLYSNDAARLTSRGLVISLPLLKRDLSAEGLYGEGMLDKGSGKAPAFTLRIAARSASANPELQSGTYLALISYARKAGHLICIWLRKDEYSGIFTRAHPSTVIMPGKYSTRFKTYTIYASVDGKLPEANRRYSGDVVY